MGGTIPRGKGRLKKSRSVGRERMRNERVKVVAVVMKKRTISSGLSYLVKNPVGRKLELQCRR